MAVETAILAISYTKQSCAAETAHIKKGIQVYSCFESAFRNGDAHLLRPPRSADLLRLRWCSYTFPSPPLPPPPHPSQVIPKVAEVLAVLAVLLRLLAVLLAVLAVLLAVLAILLVLLAVLALIFLLRTFVRRLFAASTSPPSRSPPLLLIPLLVIHYRWSRRPRESSLSSSIRPLLQPAI